MEKDWTDAVRRTQKGDLGAFEEIVRAFEQPIRAWVVARSLPGTDADDVAQNTFIQAFRRIREFDAGTSLTAWLFTIARYQLMAESTRIRRLADYHSRYAPVALAEELSRRAEAPGDPEEAALRVEHLRDCVSRLDRSAASIIRKRYAGVPLEEIADETGRSVGAIKKQLFILRDKLHECLSRKLQGETS